MESDYFKIEQRAARYHRRERYSELLIYGMAGGAAIAAVGCVAVAQLTHNVVATESFFIAGLATTVPAFLGLVAAQHYAKAYDSSTQQLETHIDEQFSDIMADASLGDLADRWPVEPDLTTDLE
ncbi:MAG: hypothetical protein ABI602_02895 [Candidatus Saccharibacteria bacterium]